MFKKCFSESVTKRRERNRVLFFLLLHLRWLQWPVMDKDKARSLICVTYMVGMSRDSWPISCCFRREMDQKWSSMYLNQCPFWNASITGLDAVNVCEWSHGWKIFHLTLLPLSVSVPLFLSPLSLFCPLAFPTLLPFLCSFCGCKQAKQ